MQRRKSMPLMLFLAARGSPTKNDYYYYYNFLVFYETRILFLQKKTFSV